METTRIATPEGAAEWWKQRAKKAERERDSETRRADNAIDDYQRVIRERNATLAAVREEAEGWAESAPGSWRLRDRILTILDDADSAV